MDGSTYDLPHFRIAPAGQPRDFRSPRGGGGGLPPRNRIEHAAKLTRELGEALAAAEAQLANLDPSQTQGTPGVYLEIFTLPNLFDPDKFELRRDGIFIASVTPFGPELRVVVFVPHSALAAYHIALEKYRTQDTKKGNPQEAARFGRIERFALGGAQSLWTDSTPFPDTNDSIWWEIWVFAHAEEHFLEAARRTDARVRDGRLEYPELIVRLVECSAETLDWLVRHTDAVSEIRSSPQTPQVITGLLTETQQEFTLDAASRIEALPNDTSVVCILDSGLNEAHPIIASTTNNTLVHAWNASWGTQDDDDHGTPMASMVLFGDIFDALVHGATLTPSARIESVKIVTGAAPPPEPELFGVVIRDAVAIVESVNPNAHRVFVSAVSMNDEGNNGMPTAWSSEYDALSASRERRRLFILAAGNVDDSNRYPTADYPQGNLVRALLEPAQSYNALTVGGYTEKTHVLLEPYAEYTALAPSGGLSPVSRTAALWALNSLVPIKPDVVFEAGNYAFGPGAQEAEVMDDYLAIAASANFQTSPFRTFGYTSAAAAEAARHAAQLMTDQPALWPETIRGLIIHSAEWTPFMEAEINATESKSDRALLLRRYGFGVPSLTRSLRSAQNDATMIAQGVLRPFIRDGSVTKTNQMVTYGLPWPRDYLLALGAAPIEMRVTLSYFIEPNPGSRGWKGRYSYASHGLRFDVRRATESNAEFMTRVNGAMRDDEYENPNHEDAAWLIGPAARSRGSIHSDIWRGVAADLANAGQIAVFPVSGWWRYLESQALWNSDARYSLLVTLRSEDPAINIYTAIENVIETGVEVEITS